MTSSYNLSRRKDKHVDFYSHEPGYAINWGVCLPEYATIMVNGDTDWKICVPLPKSKPIEETIPRTGTRRDRLYEQPVDFHPQTHPTKDRWDEWISLYGKAAESGYIKWPKKYDGTGQQFLPQKPPMTI